MLRKLGCGLLVVAVLTATGTHWLLLQSVAWSTMLAENLQSTSFSDAVQCTFDGNHPCCLCRQIAKERQEEKKSDLRVEWRRLEFSYSPSVFVFAGPAFFWEIRDVNCSVAEQSHAPPVPPPRLAV